MMKNNLMDYKMNPPLPKLNHIHSPIKATVELKQRGPSIRYIAEDGKEFTDKEEYRKHCFELHLRKMEIIYKESLFDKMGSWWFLIVFVVGYLFGVLCMI